MRFYPKTLKKLDNLVSDLNSIYGDSPISRKELTEFIEADEDIYPSVKSIVNKKIYKIKRGYYKITMPVEDIPIDVRNDVNKLHEHLFS